MDETKEDYIKMHRKMWKWIAEQYEKNPHSYENIYAYKKQYIEEELGLNEHIDNDCFACQYTKIKKIECGHTGCIFKWVQYNGRPCKTCVDDSVYDYLSNLSLNDGNSSEIIRLCICIENLEVNDDV